MSPHRIPDLINRVGSLEERVESAANARTEMIEKLSAIEQVGLAQVSAIEKLTEEEQRQAQRNELQDKDLERLKDTVHGWVGDQLKSPRSVGTLAGISTIIWGVLELAIRYFGGQ